MAANSRTSLSRVFHFAYLLKPMPSARSTEMTQTVMSVEVTESIEEAKRLTTTQQKITLPFLEKIQATSCQKRGNLTFRTRVGDFLVRVHDAASGKVTDATMMQSTGDAMLDKVTTNTFSEVAIQTRNCVAGPSADRL